MGARLGAYGPTGFGRSNVKYRWAVGQQVFGFGTSLPPQAPPWLLQSAEVERLKAELSRCRAGNEQLRGKVARLETVRKELTRTRQQAEEEKVGCSPCRYHWTDSLLFAQALCVVHVLVEQVKGLQLYW